MVEIYEPDDLEVEFAMADGTTGALVTLHESDVRPVASTDLGAVRPFTKRTALGPTIHGQPGMSRPGRRRAA